MREVEPVHRRAALPLALAAGLILALAAGCGRPAASDPALLVVVAATRHDSGGSAWARVVSGLQAVAATPPANGGVVVLPASCSSQTEVPVAAADFSSAKLLGAPTYQALAQDSRAAAALRNAPAALAKVDERATCGETDFYGALVQASALLEAAPAGWRRELLVLGSGVQQTKSLDMATWQLVLGPGNIPEYVAALRDEGQVVLTGTMVCFGGVTDGASFHLTAAQVAGIRRFWQELVRAAGGTLAAYGPGLEGCPFIG